MARDDIVDDFLMVRKEYILDYIHISIYIYIYIHICIYIICTVDWFTAASGSRLFDSLWTPSES